MKPSALFACVLLVDGSGALNPEKLKPRQTMHAAWRTQRAERTVGLARDPSPAAPGTCSKAPQHAAACARCRTAGCSPSYAWSWHAPPAMNEKKNYLPGLRKVRGVDAQYEPDVRVVARWNQSNWPGLLREKPERLRAASEAERLRLCQHYRADHNYQSWAVMLGCSGRLPTEYEPIGANQQVVVEIPCASIDLSSDPVTAGGVFDGGRYFRATHSQHAPEVCKGRRVEHIGEIGISMSVYPTAVGHFVPEQLPAALLLHATLPAHVPILVADAPVTRRYLQPLYDTGVAAPGRFMLRPLRADGTMLQAEKVLTPTLTLAPTLTLTLT